MQHLRFIAILIFCASSIGGAQAQYILSGKIIKAKTKAESIDRVVIRNKTHNDMVYADSQGNYRITVYSNDTLTFERMGFFTQTYYVRNISSNVVKNMILSEQLNVIDPVKVIGLTRYQKDSIARMDVYGKAVNYEQTASIMSPVTSLYEQFSKKYRDLRKFQEQYKDNEKQKFIDTKYTYEVVNSITKLEGDSAAYFMNAYPMDYYFARTGSALEIKIWIKNNYKEYMLRRRKI